MKSTTDEIRRRFDADVDRFSNANTGQQTTVDSDLALHIIEEGIVRTNPGAERLLDIGCGAGNFSLRVLGRIPGVACSLVDLSRPMLDRAIERIGAAGGTVEMVAQSDIRETTLEREHYDVVVAAAVLHHLRTRDEWRQVLESIYASLRPGGSLWIWDLIRHEDPGVEAVQRERYREYLTGLKDADYAQGVFDYIEREDTPESVSFIVEAMVRTGFATVDVVHKNSMFAAVSGVR